MVAYQRLFNPKSFPLVQFTQQKKLLEEAILQQVLHTLPTSLEEAVHTTISQEFERTQQPLKPFDSKKDRHFWEIIQNASSDTPQLAAEQIIRHYSQEIHGSFNFSFYKRIEKLLISITNLLLNPGTPFFGWNSMKKGKKRLHVEGNIDHLHQLANHGNFVFVPTHVSHLDSIIMDWLMLCMGFPPVLFGAGLNLYRRGFWNYALRRMGTYTIDRRKKNPLYLATLKAYSTAALEKGCNCLFYPGGGRSYTGALEGKLKLGLLSTTLQAQQLQLAAPTPKHIFIVPITLTYSGVLEADTLVHTQPRVPLRKKLATWIKGEGDIALRIAPPMNVLGELVDEAGSALQVPKDAPAFNQRLQEAMESSSAMAPLEAKLLQSYNSYHACFNSHIAAFVAVQLWSKQTGKPPEALQDTATADFQLTAEAFEQGFECVHASIQQHPSIQLMASPKDTAAQIAQGIKQLSAYHVHAPLYQSKSGKLHAQNLHLLLYYHNRITGYSLEKCLN